MDVSSTRGKVVYMQTGGFMLEWDETDMGWVGGEEGIHGMWARQSAG